MVLELSASHLAHVVGVHVARHTVPFVLPSLGLVGFVKNQSIFLIKRSYNGEEAIMLVTFTQNSSEQ